MAIQLDDLVARLRLDTSSVSKSVGAVDSSLSRVGTTGKRTFRQMASGALKIAAGFAIARKAVQFVGDSLAEGREANKVAALTAQRIKTMGDVAGISAKGVANLANAISKKTGIDDEQIQASENLILSFSQIQNRGEGVNAIFNRTAKAAVDLSAGGFGSIEGASKQLGKALQDPIKGVAALARSGVTFTEKQKGTIKTLVETGHILKAQKVVLGEVEKQVKGSAEAQATAADKAKVGFQNLQEQIGVALIPVIDKLAGFMSGKVFPAVSKFITQMQNGKGAGGEFADGIGRAVDVAKMLWEQVQTQLLPVLGDLWDMILANLIPAVEAILPTLKKWGAYLVSHVIPAVSDLIGWLVKHEDIVVPVIAGILAMVAAIKIYRGVMLVAAAVQAAFNAVLLLNPIGVVVLLLVGLAAGLVVAYKKSEKFREVVDKALDGIAAAWRFLWNNVIAPIIRYFLNGLASMMDDFGTLLDALSHVPGFGWVGDLGDKLHGAADKTHELADGIKDIPKHTDVEIDVHINAAQLAKVNQQLGAINSRSANGVGGKKKNSGLGLTGILSSLFDGIAPELGVIESQVSSDVADLITRITDHYTARSEHAQKQIAARFKHLRAQAQKALEEAQKTKKNKKDDKAAQAELDALDGKERKATNAAIARFNAKTKAAKAAIKGITAALIANAHAQDVANAALDGLHEQLTKAQDDLTQLQEQAASFAAGIAQMFTDFGNVVGLGVRQIGEETTVTITDLLDDLRDRVVKAARFAQLIAQLTAAGLNHTTIQQLLAAGVEGGLATAEAIASGGAGAIDEINTLTSQLTGIGEQLGGTLASTFYGAGIETAKSVVAGLVESIRLKDEDLAKLVQNAAKLRRDLAVVLGNDAKAAGKDTGANVVAGVVEGIDEGEGDTYKAMRRIAKTMLKALRDELDMHSPSRKLRAEGLLAGTSVAIGLDASIPAVEAAMSRLAGAATFDPAALTRAQLGTRSLGSFGLGRGALSPAPLNLQVYLGDKEVSELVRVEINGVLQPLDTLARQGAL